MIHLWTHYYIWLQKIINFARNKLFMAYICKNPKLISSPKGKVEVIEVLYDGADDPAYSLALIKWEGRTKIGIRWNIAEAEWYDAKKQN